jgi:anti-sigma factor ChrR (cupin superfamily)
MQEVPFITNITLRRREQDRAIGSVATESEKVGACPSDETLATFLEGKLTGKAHQAMLAHLNHCPSCYYHWLEAASYLDELEPAAPRTSAAGSLSRIWQRAALERIQALLVAIEHEANEQTRANLSRGLEITLEQLSP